MATCIWIIISYAQNDDSSWIHNNDFINASDVELYITSLYFCVTTFTTVGYGDITPQTPIEKCFVIVLMLVGIIFFSYFIGSISTILNKTDTNKLSN